MVSIEVYPNSPKGEENILSCRKVLDEVRFNQVQGKRKALLAEKDIMLAKYLFIIQVFGAATMRWAYCGTDQALETMCMVSKANGSRSNVKIVIAKDGIRRSSERSPRTPEAFLELFSKLNYSCQRVGIL